METAEPFTNDNKTSTLRKHLAPTVSTSCSRRGVETGSSLLVVVYSSCLVSCPVGVWGAARRHDRRKPVASQP